jgi:hypothetical protein
MNDYMININPHEPHMPAENYSHMMMEDEHLVGDGVGDDGGEEALEILLSRVENGINQFSKMKIMVVAAL